MSNLKKNRSAAERRRRDWSKIIHKRNICKIWYWEELFEKGLNQLNKANLSCDREFEHKKTNSIYNGYNPKIQDIRRTMEMEYELKELEEVS